MLLVSALLPRTPADNSYTPLLLARVACTLSKHPSTEKEFAKTKGFILLRRYRRLVYWEDRKFRDCAGLK